MSAKEFTEMRKRMIQEAEGFLSCHLGEFSHLIQRAADKHRRSVVRPTMGQGNIDARQVSHSA